MVDFSVIFNESLKIKSNEDIQNFLSFSCNYLKLHYLKINYVISFEFNVPKEIVHEYTINNCVFYYNGSQTELEPFFQLFYLVIKSHINDSILSHKSHELRTPLNAILTSSYNLSKKFIDNKDVSLINKKCIDILSLIDQSSEDVNYEFLNIDELFFNINKKFPIDVFSRKTSTTHIYSNSIKLLDVFNKLLTYINKPISIQIESNKNYMIIKLHHKIEESLIELIQNDVLSINCTISLVKDIIVISIPLSKQEIYEKFSGKILLIEDDKINQDVTKQFLNNLGFEVDIADNGLIGLNTFKENQFNYNCIVMDCQMPIMDGFECTSTIRTINPTIPIIGFSANSLQSNKDKCITSGMNSILLKPLNPTLFINQLNQLLPMCSNSFSDYELNLIRSSSNNEFTQNLINKFFSIINKEIKEIELNLSLQKWDNVAQKFHKLKSTFGSLGCTKTQELLNEFQFKQKFNDNDYFLFRSHIKSDINNIITWCNNNQVKLENIKEGVIC